MDDDHREKIDPQTNFYTESSWRLGDDSVDSAAYFFGSDDRESSILSEFGWNLQPDNSVSGADFDRIDSNFGGNRTLATLPESSDGTITGSETPVQSIRSAEVNNPSVSSSTSEDLPEKSTGSADNKA